MTPERWQQVKEIFNSAIAYRPEERSLFISQACSGDEELRSEVESLIASHEESGSFIDKPAFEAAATLLANEKAELKSGLDQIWDVPPEKRQGFWYFVRTRVTSVGMILALGFLLLVSLVVSAALTALERLWGGRWTAEVASWLNFAFSFALVVVLFGTIYKILPSVKIAWRDAFVGAIVTALLFMLGKFAIGAYIGNSNLASTYGAAGSIILVLVWVYYSAQIFLLGAEFTRSYAYQLGSFCAGKNPRPAGCPPKTEPPSPPT